MKTLSVCIFMGLMSGCATSVHGTHQSVGITSVALEPGCTWIVYRQVRYPVIVPLVTVPANEIGIEHTMRRIDKTYPELGRDMRESKVTWRLEMVYVPKDLTPEQIGEFEELIDFCLERRAETPPENSGLTRRES